MAGAAAYEGVEHLNRIPAVNDVLMSVSPSLGDGFPGQNPTDITVAGPAGAILAGLWDVLNWRDPEDKK